MKLILNLLAYSSCFFCFSQNLVRNPSFEDYNNDPSSYGNGDVAKALYWLNVGPGTADYFHSDFNNIFSRVPQNECGTQTPHSGNAYAGIYTCQPGSDSNVREYIRTEFENPLVSGTVYEIAFYTSLSDLSGIASSFGAMISTSPNDNFNGYLMLATETFHTNGTITDKQNWTLVSGTYTASGGEQYLTIGGFFDDLNADTTTVDNSVYQISYYYIDDVSVIAAGIAGVNSFHDKELYIYPNPANTQLTIEHFTEISGNYKISLTDLTSRVVQEFSLEPNQERFEIDLKNHVEGVYFVNIFQDGVLIENKKITIQH